MYGGQPVDAEVQQVEDLVLHTHSSLCHVSLVIAKGGDDVSSATFYMAYS